MEKRSLLSLSTRDHSRDAAGLTYIYPVLSRRSGGLSIGINLNPNNACNWRCVYCQVPGLQRGTAPPIDVGQLRNELTGFLGMIAERQPFVVADATAVAPELQDIAISGNGEPSSCRELLEVMDVIAAVLAENLLRQPIKLVMITNGSLLHQSRVRQALARWGELGGELWFKLDRVTAAGLREINQTAGKTDRIFRNLCIATQYCRTSLQTCVFQVDGMPPPAAEVAAYLDFLRRCLAAQLPLAGVSIYGLARPSMQPEATRLTAVSTTWLTDFVAAIEALKIPVKVSP